jgi:hypothetical protein
VDDTSNTSDDDDEFLPVLRPLPTRVELTNNGCQETEDLHYTERPAEEIPETRADQNVEGEGNVGEGQEGDQAVEVEPNQAEPGDVEANNRPNDRVAGTEETIVPNVANRPQRNRQVPQRFTYYAPGHAACYRCGAIITQFHQFQQQPYQPIPQPYQIPMPNQHFHQFQQQPYQPIPQPYQIPMPNQHPWQYNYPMFPSHWYW